MCTVSWLHSEGGYQLFCNRDEKRNRPKALPPRVRETGGVRFVAPDDGAHGGTWLLANECGVTLCLLNGTCLGDVPETSPGDGVVSRGLLVLELAAARSSAEACTRVRQLDLTRYAPFTLLALEAGLPASIAEWDGRECIVLPDAEPCMPLASSSFDAKGVRFLRREHWRRLAALAGEPDATTHCEFHEDHGHTPGPYSPCMHRDDAETVSFSWVTATHNTIEFFYSPAAPCQWVPGTTVTLSLL